MAPTLQSGSLRAFQLCDGCGSTLLTATGKPSDPASNLLIHLFRPLAQILSALLNVTQIEYCHMSCQGRPALRSKLSIGATCAVQCLWQAANDLLLM